jgi:hypothetical protein
VHYACRVLTPTIVEFTSNGFWVTKAIKRIFDDSKLIKILYEHLKNETLPNIRMGATRQILEARSKIILKWHDHQIENFPKQNVCLVPQK